MRPVRRDLLSLATLIAVTGVFFFPLIRGFTFSTVAGYENAVYPWVAARNNLPFTPQSDQAELSYPWDAFIHNSLARNELPLWNPYSFFGEPFFSNGSSGVLYPPRVLVACLGLSPSVAHDVLSVIDMLGAGIFMFLLMRALHCRRAGSLLAATAWMVGSFNTAWLHMEVSAPITMLLPLDCLCVLRAATSRNWHSYCLAWWVLAITLVSGHLPFMCTVFATAAAYGAALGARALLRDWRNERPLSPRLLQIGLFSILPPLLAAIVLLPTFISILHSARALPAYEAVHKELLVQPQVFLYSFWPPRLPCTDMRMHKMAFVGTLMPVLALLGLSRRRPGVALFGTLAVAVPLLALDTPLLPLAFTVLPWIGTMHNLGRLFFLWNFALAGLGGLGLDNLLARVRLRLRRTHSPGPVKRKLAWMAALIWLLTAVQLITYGRMINPTFHPRQGAFLFPATPLITALRRVDQGGRILPLSPLTTDGAWMPPMLHGATSMVWSIPSAGGYDSVVPRRIYHLLEVLCGRSPEEVMRSPDGGTLQAVFNPKSLRYDLIARLGINYLVGTPALNDRIYWPAKGASPLKLITVYNGPDGIVWRVAGVQAGPRIVHHAIVVDGPANALFASVSDSFDSADSVVLERNEMGGETAPVPRPGGSSHAEVRTRTNNEIIVDAWSAATGWLVLPESWDLGWTATVNGRPEPVLHANYAFRAVRIPDGESRIKFRYTPADLKWGIIITVLAGAASLILALRLSRASH
jgi:hypothetical protein